MGRWALASEAVLCGLHSPPASTGPHTPSIMACAAVALQNLDSRTRTVKVRPPKSKYFTLREFFKPLALAGGLETRFEVSLALRATCLDWTCACRPATCNMRGGHGPAWGRSLGSVLTLSTGQSE
jgi:hypothetical protein